jgi:hypothetical protein
MTAAPVPQAILHRLAQSVSASREHCDLLAHSAFPDEQKKFTRYLNGLLTDFGVMKTDSVYSEFLSWCGDNHMRISTHLVEANIERKKLLAIRKQLHQGLRKSLWLSPDASRLQNFLAGIPSH